MLSTATVEGFLLAADLELPAWFFSRQFIINVSEVILALIAIHDGAPPFSDLHCFFDPALVIVRLRVYNLGLTPSYDVVRLCNMVRSRRFPVGRER